MIEKEQLQELTLPQLIAIDEQLTAYIFKQTKGEPVHPDYKRNRKAYSQLIKETVRLERTVRKFRKGQAERIASLVHIHRIKAQEDGEDYMNDDAWGAEDSALANDLADSIYPVFDLGAETTAQEIGVGTAVSSDTSPQSKFLNQYIVTLAGNLNKTTKADITQAVKTSLQLGENRDELTARIDDILNDTNRSEMIAQTESIRAYAQGRLAVGRELNFDSKQWRWPGNSNCPICPALEEMGPINIDDTFDTGSDSLGEVDGPPAHPWCQCSVKLLNQQDDNVEGRETLNSIKAGWITKDGHHIFLPDGGGESHTEHFQKTPYSTNKISEFSLHDAEHQIKYNGALQAAFATKNDAVKDLIYKADVTNANDPTEIAGMILHSLPPEFQNDNGVRLALINWGKSAQMIYNEGRKQQ